MSWRIWVDTGGTFTDCLAVNPKGDMKRLKVLSSSVIRGTIEGQPNADCLKVSMEWPSSKDIFAGFSIRIIGTSFKGKISSANPSANEIKVTHSIQYNVVGKTVEITSDEEVPVLATRLLTETALNEAFPLLEMKLGSTRGTNAILERKGAKTAFLVTKGFKDLLLIGNQQREDLFTLSIQKEPPLYEMVEEVDERIESNGNVLTALSENQVARIIRILRKRKIESVAIAFLNSYRNPSHEFEMKACLTAAGFQYVSCSSELSSQLKILPRAETAVANAYLAPIIHSYVSRISQKLSATSLKIMTSAGSLTGATSFHPKDSLLSGPAGGVVGAAIAAGHSRQDRLITFDMGGTSTDVSLYDRGFDYRFESRVGRFKILSPSLAIETIAAGGGSICDFDGFRFTVGPASAGASPGPACYGDGGPLTLTDVNLLLGRLDVQNFSIPIRLNHAEKALKDLLNKVKKRTGKQLNAYQVLESFCQIANEKMADAIKKVSIQLGHNPAEFALLSFGGAGGQHACQLASMLSMRKVLVPYDAGLLSAYGIGHANIERFEEQLILEPLRNVRDKLKTILASLFNKSRMALEGEGYHQIELHKELVFLRFQGQESTIEIEFKSVEKLLPDFKKKYQTVYGHWLDDRTIEIESARVIAVVKQSDAPGRRKAVRKYLPAKHKRSFFIHKGEKRSISIYRWEDLKAGAHIEGPSLVISNNSTTFVEPGWIFDLDQHNNGILVRVSKQKMQTEHSGAALLELFTNRFTAVAQEMGALLQRTSFSVNVKERLDFSCALLDKDGYLVVNAPHIPVHLGSLGVCVRETLKAIPMRQGDVIITNHPAYGGSHLPDITLIKPVFYRGKRIAFVANRAHHAEIGGKRPGSMPADATSLLEEGVVIAPMYLLEKGKPRWDRITTLFTKGPYPTRLLNENLADLNGALASVNFGERALMGMCRTYGIRPVQDNMNQLRTHARALLSERIKTLSVGKYQALEQLDDGAPLQVLVQVQRNKMVFDFTGSSPVHPGNLNATQAIVQSTILYALRLLINRAIPMNEGLMDLLKVKLPHGLLNPDFTKGHLPAVVGGNTEVSQRLTDTLLKAFKLAACSQGTMNNFLFGNEQFGYYETICGGTGAGNGFHGTDAVHQHMTNTRITDPEVIELRYPVRLEQFSIRRRSGGIGKWNGGNGVIREFYFKAPLEVSLLTQHRVIRPYGLAGGGEGKCGEQWLIPDTGKRVRLKGADGCHVNPGDRIVIKTPGGGAFGKSGKGQ